MDYEELIFALKQNLNKNNFRERKFCKKKKLLVILNNIDN